MKNQLHVFGQHAWHDEVLIVGNAETLRALAKVLEKAAREQVAESPAFYVNDGEGFHVIACRLDDEKTADVLAVPYSADYAEEKNKLAIKPHELYAATRARLAAQEPGA